MPCATVWLPSGKQCSLGTDADCEVMKKYEVMTEEAVTGSSRASVHRSTFVIDKKGVVRHILRDLNPREHASAVLKLVRQIHGH